MAGCILGLSIYRKSFNYTIMVVAITQGDQETTMAPYVLMITFAGQGSINPFVRFGKILVASGLVTFTVVETAGADMFRAGGLKFVDPDNFHIEFISDGFPIDVKIPDLNDYFIPFSKAAPQSFEVLLRKLDVNGRPVSYVISNPFIPWAGKVATRLGIPTALLWPESACVYAVIKRFLDPGEELPAHGEVVELTGVPPLSLDDLPIFLRPGNPVWCLTDALREQFRSLDEVTWILGNTFDVFEEETLRSVAVIKPIGPLGPSDLLGHVSGDLVAVNEECLDWLSSHPPASVIYVSLGSLTVLLDKQMEELASGLEHTGKPFLWVVKPNKRRGGNILPVGFMERVAGQGMVVTWCPQTRVLSHPSVACFVTHCGWNSTTESLVAGVPVVGFPQSADQPLNAKLVEVHGFGVKFVKGPDGVVGREEVARRLVEVTEGKSATVLKENAAKWKNAARAATTKGGSSHKNILDFVEDVQQTARSQKSINGYENNVIEA